MLKEIIHYLTDLRNACIENFEKFESIHQFEIKPWEKKGVGKGEMGLIRGEVFEKAAVNYSIVQGDQFPMQDGSGPFIATGVSLITHMKNPYMPTTHFNVRYIQLKDRYWFGGGFDLTPMGLENEEDTRYFHEVAKEALDRLNPSFYPQFYEDAKNYFFIPHRNKERGVGGIFFDHYSTGSIEKDFRLMQAVGEAFLKAIIPIYEKRKDTPYTQEEKVIQNKNRAHYVEFNLIYDRGTKFGLHSNGNTESILSSLPPCATW
jgi:coproporphyrinogen III oxidase